MTSLAYRFFWFVFILAFVSLAFHLFAHPWVVQQYSGLLTNPTHAIQQIMNQLPATTTGTTLP